MVLNYHKIRIYDRRFNYYQSLINIHAIIQEFRNSSIYKRVYWYGEKLYIPKKKNSRNSIQLIIILCISTNGYFHYYRSPWKLNKRVIISDYNSFYLFEIHLILNLWWIIANNHPCFLSILPLHCKFPSNVNDECFFNTRRAN